MEVFEVLENMVAEKAVVPWILDSEIWVTGPDSKQQEIEDRNKRHNRKVGTQISHERNRKHKRR
jgi:hypothetical protein